MSQRYIAQREHGSDWGVVDTHRHNLSVATGLTQEEAEEAAVQWQNRWEKEAADHA